MRRRLTAAGALATVLPNRAVAQPAASRFRRLALVVGNSVLGGKRTLSSATHDAALMQSTLERIGFTVARLDDPTARELLRGLSSLSLQSSQAPSLALVYYAGTCLAPPVNYSGGGLWLWGAASAMAQSARDAQMQSVSLDELLGVFSLQESRRLIVAIDGSFEWPFDEGAGSASRPRPIDMPEHTALLLSDALGGAGGESEDGRNGRFTLALAERMSEVGLPLERIVAGVRESVRRASGGRQTPYTAMDGALNRLILNPGAPRPSPQQPGQSDDPKATGRSARVPR